MKVFMFYKRQLIILGAIFLCICSIIGLSIKRTVQVNTTPATNKIVILDAGHGVPEEGICLTYFLRM